MATSIEDKEIRGVNLRWLITLVMTVGTTVGCYYRLVATIENYAIETKYKIEFLQAQINDARQENASQNIQLTDIKKELGNKENKKER